MVGAGAGAAATMMARRYIIRLDLVGAGELVILAVQAERVVVLQELVPHRPDQTMAQRAAAC